MADFVGKDRFVTDEDAVAVRLAVVSGKAKDLALVAAREFGHTASEFVGEGKQVLKGNVLAEWDEVNLVVAADAGAVAGATTSAEL